MKNLRTAALCASAILWTLCSFAQQVKPPVNEPDYNKPRLFDHLPDSIPVSLAEINTLINAEVGRTTSLRTGSSNPSALHFDGEVVSTTNKYNDQIKSVVIRSSNFNGARFTLSRITKSDGVVSYTGRIISFQHGDLYELQNQDGQLILVKRNFYDLVNE